MKAKPKEYTLTSNVRVNLVGCRFGMLTVTHLLGSYKGKNYWKCVCDCGNTSEVQTSSLKGNNTTSCGCLTTINSIAKSKTHGMTGSPLYGAWRRMIQRCEDAGCPDYAYYGARGIYVCDRWHDFSNFYADMGERPDGMTLERVDNNGPYSPENCVWASRKEQGQNTRQAKLVVWRGESLTVAEWERRLGWKPGVLKARLNRLGYSVEEAMTKPVKCGGLLPGREYPKIVAAHSKKGRPGYKAYKPPRLTVSHRRVALVLDAVGVSRSSIAKQFGVTGTTITQLIDGTGAYDVSNPYFV